jgi:Zn-dependent alcohol dehydrogenase
MRTRAAYEAGKPLVVEEVELDGPKAGDLRMVAPNESGT